jgi:TetR/AcrR family acrAB operon transcriptional repressor
MSRAENTRAILLDAALAAFARRGVRATTLEQVAASAKLTRGAVYWHFPDKSALVQAVFENLAWPFDIGSDLDAYRQTGNALSLLGEVLCRQISNCLADTRQRRMVEVVVRYRGTSDLPAGLSARLDQMVLQALQHLNAVIKLAYMRGELRLGLTPTDVAHYILATSTGVIAVNMLNQPPDPSSSFHMLPELVLFGIRAQTIK